MNASSLRDRFSLDYLVSGPNAPDRVAAPEQTPSQPQSQAFPASVEPCLDSFGMQVKKALESSPNQTSTVLALAQQCSIRLDVMIPVMQYLTGRGLVTKVAAEPSGNDTYKLTAPVAL